MAPLVHTVQHTTADRAFRQARRAAVREELQARLLGRSAQLLSYDAVVRTIKTQTPKPVGACDVHLDAIVGSVGRYADFTRGFHPRHDSERTRWTRVHSLMTDASAGGIPPIEVYKVGDAYFVLDGNHRVSVARTLGAILIRARVTDVQSRVPLTPEDNWTTLSIKADYADFLELTHLDVTRPSADLQMTVAGKYAALLDEIQDLQRELNQVRDYGHVSMADAAAAWYDRRYLPAVQTMRSHPHLHTDLARTEADIYVWLLEYAHARRARCGYSMTAAAAAHTFIRRREHAPSELLSQLGCILRRALHPPEPCADVAPCR